jgi:heat shock protein HslJ
MKPSCLLAIAIVEVLVACQSEPLGHSARATELGATRACGITPSATLSGDIPCAHQALDKASLTGSYWRPVEIDKKAVRVKAGQREPHIVLESEHRMRGFGGCNQIQGGYEVQGNGLRFIGTATTRMFCEGSMEQEARFLLAMEATATYAITGDTLELYDASGRPLARFESRPLP